jgi:hypothetical protein
MGLSAMENVKDIVSAVIKSESLKENLLQIKMGRTIVLSDAVKLRKLCRLCKDITEIKKAKLLIITFDRITMLLWH